MSCGALILSTGSRTGPKEFDPLQMVGQLSVTQRLIMTFQLAGADPIVLVVSDSERGELEKHASRMGVVFLPSHVPGGEMMDSARTGLSYVSGLCDQILVTPVDVPLFSVETVTALMSSNKVLAVPRCQGRNGHPLLVGAEAVPAIVRYQGTGGLRAAVQACGYELAEVEVADPGIHLKARDAGENTAMIAGHNLSRWRPVAKLQLAKESTFFGPGIRQLLKLIGKTGSVRLACEQMGLSYSKAWKMLNGLEKQLAHPVVLRKKGGRQGGETQLTPEGESLIQKFDAFERECQQAVNEIFLRHFGDME